MADELHEKLRALLRSDPVPQVRQEAARAVSVTGTSPEATVDALVEALDDANVAVRRAAVLALGRVRHESAGEALLEAVTAHPELWQETSAALAANGSPALVPRLLPLCDHDDTHVRCGAIRAVAALSAGAASSEPLFVYEDEEGHRHPLF